MSNLRERMREAGTSVPAPDLWPLVLRRTEESDSMPMDEGPPWSSSRLGVAVVALAASVVTLVVLILAFRGGPAVPSLTNSPTSGALRANGKIAFVRAEPTLVDGAIPHAAIHVIDPDGTHLDLVGSGVWPGSAPSWSPDGSRLSVVKDGLVVVSSSGGHGTRVVDCSSIACAGQGPAAWSPDSSTLVFWADRSNQEGLWSVPANGGEPHLLSPGVDGGQPSFSPDGSLLAAAGRDAGHDANSVMIIDATTGQIIRRIAPPGLSVGFSVSWDPSGEWLVFDVTPDDAHPIGGMYIVHPDGSSLAPLPVHPLGCRHNEGCWVLQPSWSPDGRLIVYTVGLPKIGSDGSVGDLWILNVETGKNHALTSDRSALDCCASWQGLEPVASAG
jgi:Tol biopolymer transport system component